MIQAADAETVAIPFIDLQAQRSRIDGPIQAAIARVLAHGQFIMGPEVMELEQRLAEFSGARHALTCASGTDAMVLILMAWGVGPGDAVFVPAFTFVATAEVVALVGATPVFVDVLAETFNMSPDSLESALGVASERGLNPRAVIPVDLFGQPADYQRIVPIARAHDLKVLADAAQSFGAELDGKRVGVIGDATATSFFPAKPLGCYGDGGAVFTDDDRLAAQIRSLRSHGQGTDRYDNVAVGINGRLDTLQAAILIEKLAIFEDEIRARGEIAERYGNALGNLVTTPKAGNGTTSIWAQYTIQLEDRDRVRKTLGEVGIPSAVHYPIPLNCQAAYQEFPTVAGGAPVSETLSRRVLSLPMHPYLDSATQDRIVEALRRALGVQVNHGP